MASFLNGFKICMKLKLIKASFVSRYMYTISTHVVPDQRRTKDCYIKSHNLRSMSTITKATTYKDVLNFWFDESKGIDEKYKLWFGGGPDADKTILDKFGGLVSQARGGELAKWEDLSQGVSAGLAFIILIDQFCRNIYRGTADQFSHDSKALKVALKIIESGGDKELTFLQRQFVYLPVEHCEKLEMQEKNLQLFGDLATDAAGSDVAGAISMVSKYAVQHHEVISKFGRYPKRNAALGRENTPEEIDILQNWPYGF